MVTCVAGGVNSGCSAKGLYLKSGVIGKTVITIVLLYVTGFLQGVVLEGIAGFGDILMAVYVTERQHLKAVAKYLADLFKLMGVIGGKNQFHAA